MATKQMFVIRARLVIFPTVKTNVNAKNARWVFLQIPSRKMGTLPLIDASRVHAASMER
jgi:hypothetical protein